MTGLGGMACFRAVRNDFGCGAQQFRRGQKRHQSEHRDDCDILEEQHGETRLSAVGIQNAALVEGLQHDRGRGERQHQADRQRNAPGLAKHHRDRHHHQRGGCHLPAAKADQPSAHLPQLFRLELKPDQEQHHHHAELGKVLDGDDIHVEQRQDRADHDAGNQIAKHRAQPEPRGNGHGGDAGDEKDKGEK